ncbi:MAG: serine/threonine protein kinase [Deltaproteobacteria bacterium]|nr:serine/threonine protein kinase [Deltaproteobacteria bacterium]MCW5801712.1 serine/threonine protein kinase [Deltaproteobacteria bacterium]
MSEQTFGTWRLDGLIAVGGLGEVWRARREGQVAALKRLHTHLARNEDGRGMFANEQQLALGLPRHPNLVHAIENGVVDGRPYVALELAPGEDLRRIVAPAGGPVVLPRARALAIARAACAGVAHLHKFGWIHGDLNPGNLIVDVDDRVTVIDLGVARRSGEGGAVRGTHAYMAPEQVKGGAWTPATDVFALGVVLWELASGARLFHRGPPWLSMAAVVEADVPPLEDPALDAIVRAALAKDPAARIATPAELAARL